MGERGGGVRKEEGGWKREEEERKKGGRDMVGEGMRREREGKWESEGMTSTYMYCIHVMCQATCMYCTCAREPSVSSAYVHV